MTTVIPTYDPGDFITLQGQFKLDGVLTNTTTVILVVRDPDGATQTFQTGVDPNMTNPSTGTYTRNFYIPDNPGQWRYSFYGTGTVISYVEEVFNVRKRQAV